MQLELLERRDTPATSIFDFPRVEPRPDVVAAFGGSALVQYIVADLTGDLLGEEIYVGGPGAANRVLVLSEPTGLPGATPVVLLNGFLQGESTLRTGLSVGLLRTAGAVDSLVLGFGQGGGSVIVKLEWNGTAFDETARFAFGDPSFRGGVRLTTGDLNRDGADDVVCLAGAGGGPVAEVFDGRDLSTFGGPFFVAPPDVRLVRGDEFAFPSSGAVGGIQGPGLPVTPGIVIIYPALDTDPRELFLSDNAVRYFLPDGTDVTDRVAGFDPPGVDPFDLIVTP